MELRDDVVVLRHWREDDAPVVYAACQDQEIQHWLPLLPRPYTDEDAHAFVSGALDLGPHQFAVTLDGEVVASIGMRVNESGIGHVGYWCTRERRGQGITTRALREISRYGLAELRLERLELLTDPDNAASQRVAEKVGFQREGVLRSHMPHPDGRRRDSIIFSLLPGELR